MHVYLGPNRNKVPSKKVNISVKDYCGLWYQWTQGNGMTSLPIGWGYPFLYNTIALINVYV